MIRTLINSLFLTIITATPGVVGAYLPQTENTSAINEHPHGLASDQYSEDIPYIEIGNSNYYNGYEDATFSNGILANELNNIRYYIYISNKNFYNLTSVRTPYTTLNEDLVFINIVFYTPGTTAKPFYQAQGFTFPILNNNEAFLEVVNWKNIQKFNLYVRRYMQTNQFDLKYEYTYNNYANGNLETHENWTPIIDTHEAHFYFNAFINETDMILTDYFTQTIIMKFNSYTNGYDDGYNDGEEKGYADGLRDGQAGGPINNVFALLEKGWQGMANVLEIEVFPNITIGGLLLIPLLFTIGLFIFKVLT